jgi:hypothetical protein
LSEKESTFAKSNAGAYMLYVGALVVFIFSSVLLSKYFVLHAAVIGAQLIAILGSALVFRAIVDDAADWPALDRLGAGPLGYLVLALACISLAFTANIGTSLFVELVPPLQESAEQYQALLEELILDAEGWTKVVAIVSVSVVAPLCEETLFRGTILQEQRKVESFTVAIVVNGFLFSVFHLNPVGFLSLWLVGAFFAHMTLSSGNLWVPILAHSFFNLFNSTILPAAAPEMDKIDSKYGASELAIALVIFGPLTAGLWSLTMRLLHKHRDRRKVPEESA